jgi:hypothetical protein
MAGAREILDRINKINMINTDLFIHLVNPVNPVLKGYVTELLSWST